MKIIDARTGQHVRLGIPVVIRSEGIDGHTGESTGIEDDSYVLEEAGPAGLIWLPVRVRILGTGEAQTLALRIRYMHPGFPFQRVAFVET